MMLCVLHIKFLDPLHVCVEIHCSEAAELFDHTVFSQSGEPLSIIACE